MKIARCLIALSLVSGFSLTATGGDPFPKAPTFSTLITTSLAIEGLTGDNRGNLYVGGAVCRRRQAVSRVADQYRHARAGGGRQHPGAERWASARRSASLSTTAAGCT